MADVTAVNLTALADLMQAGKVTPGDRSDLSLSETADEIRYLEKRHARGKVIVRVE